MDGLWRWDIDAFRVIHLAGRDLLADPFLQGLTNMGLAHIQAMPLLIAAFRSKMPVWAQSMCIGMGLSLSYFAEDRGIMGAAAFALCLILFWGTPRRAALGALCACLLAGILRIVAEGMVNRQRPANFDFAHPLEPVFGYSSFPSGHAATSMAIAVFLLWALKDKDRLLAWGVLGWALLIGLSRIIAGVHYPLDVLAGFALALMTATGLWLFWEKKGWSIEKGPEEIALPSEP